MVFVVKWCSSSCLAWNLKISISKESFAWCLPHIWRLWPNGYLLKRVTPILVYGGASLSHTPLWERPFSANLHMATISTRVARIKHRISPSASLELQRQARWRTPLDDIDHGKYEYFLLEHAHGNVTETGDSGGEGRRLRPWKPPVPIDTPETPDWG